MHLPWVPASNNGDAFLGDGRLWERNLQAAVLRSRGRRRNAQTCLQLSLLGWSVCWVVRFVIGLKFADREREVRHSTSSQNTFL